MPVFTLKCQTCGHIFDFSKYKSYDKPECPKCKEADETKFSKEVAKGASFQLKGKGWYRDGY